MSTKRWRILLVGLVLAGCGSAVAPTPSPAPTATAAPSILPTLTGSFVLKDATKIALNPNGPGCIGTGGYSDVGTGMPVTVKDQAGVIIATGATAFDYITAVCALKFSIPNLPMASFYSIEVGHRGALSFSAADLAAAGWHVDFELGK